MSTFPPAWPTPGPNLRVTAQYHHRNFVDVYVISGVPDMSFSDELEGLFYKPTLGLLIASEISYALRFLKSRAGDTTAKPGPSVLVPDVVGIHPIERDSCPRGTRHGLMLYHDVTRHERPNVLHGRDGLEFGEDDGIRVYHRAGDVTRTKSVAPIKK